MLLFLHCDRSYLTNCTVTLLRLSLDTLVRVLRLVKRILVTLAKVLGKKSTILYLSFVSLSTPDHPDSRCTLISIVCSVGEKACCGNDIRE